MKKILLTLILVFSLFSVSLADELTCQYTENENYTKIVTQVHTNTSEVYDLLLTFTDFGKSTDYNKPNFYANNNYDFDITIQIKYTQVVSSSLTGMSMYDSNALVTIPKNSRVELKGTHGFSGSYSSIIDPESIVFTFIEPNATVSNDSVTKQRIICTQCLGVNCTNDGGNCSIASQCDGKYCINNVCRNELLSNGELCNLASDCADGYCIRNKCNNQPTCYNNDCRCSSDKIERIDKLGCELKNSTQIGFVPSSGRPEQCMTGYMNESTSKCLIPTGDPCEKNSECDLGYCVEKICGSENDYNDYINKINSFYWGFGIILIIMFGLITYFIISKVRQKTIEKEIELIKERKELLDKQSIKIEKDKENLKRLKAIKKKTLKEKRKIEELNKELNNDKLKHEKLKKGYEKVIKKKKLAFKELIKPHKSVISDKIIEWRNSNLTFYPCYVNNGKKTDILIHIDQANKGIFRKYKGFFNKRYPNKRLRDLEVHHIDRDKDNYRFSNMIIISKKEHKRIDHNMIIKGNRKSGLKILRKLRIINPHIPELKN